MTSPTELTMCPEALSPMDQREPRSPEPSETWGSCPASPDHNHTPPQEHAHPRTCHTVSFYRKRPENRCLRA